MQTNPQRTTLFAIPRGITAGFTLALLCSVSHGQIGEEPFTNALFYDRDCQPPLDPFCFELMHPSALDSRFHDYDSDGDLDIFTFFPFTPVPVAAQEYWIRLFENRLDQLAGPAFVERFDFFEDRDLHLRMDNPAFPATVSSPYTIRFMYIDSDDSKDLVIINQRSLDTYSLFQPGTNQYGAPVPLTPSQPSDNILVHPTGSLSNWTCASTASATQQATWIPNPYRWSVGAWIGNDGSQQDNFLVVTYRDSRPRVFVLDPNGIGFVEWQVIGGTSEFLDEGRLSVEGVASRSIVLADLDGDGDDDCIVARNTQSKIDPGTGVAAVCFSSQDKINGDLHDAVRVYRNMSVENELGLGAPWFEPWYRLAPGCNDGNQQLQTEWNLEGPAGRSPTLSVTVADMNNDGALDIIVPVSSGPKNEIGSTGLLCKLDRRTRIYLNTQDAAGHYGFCGVDLNSTGGVPVPLPPGFLDTYRTPTHWIGNGAPLARQNEGPNMSSAHAEPVDIDGDGLMDLLIAHHGQSTPGKPIRRDSAWLNQSTPTTNSFVRAKAYLPPSNARLRFPPQTVVGFVNDETRYIRSGDLNGDGRPDLIFTQFIRDAPLDPNGVPTAPTTNGEAPCPWIYMHVQ